MKAIATTGERGIKFRSRLEAKWARMFMLLRWPWEYEPIDLDGYIPDFILPFPAGPVLVEVKPEMYVEDLSKHVKKARKAGWNESMLVVGAKLFSNDWLGVQIGLWNDCNGDDTALLHTCRHCSKQNMLSYNGLWKCCHCGATGKTIIDLFNRQPTIRAVCNDVSGLWTQATNLTQWQPRQTTSRAQSAQVRAMGRSLEGMRE